MHNRLAPKLQRVQGRACRARSVRGTTVHAAKGEESFAKGNKICVLLGNLTGLVILNTYLFIILSYLYYLNAR